MARVRAFKRRSYRGAAGRATARGNADPNLGRHSRARTNDAWTNPNDGAGINSQTRTGANHGRGAPGAADRGAPRPYEPGLLVSWKLAGVVAFGTLAALTYARLVQGDETGTASWDLSRATGFAGYLLLWGSVVTGMSVNLRLRPGMRHQGVVLELHRVFSTLAMTYVAVHTAGILMDPRVQFSIADGFVPFTSDYRPFAVGVGTIAQWLLAITLISTALSRRMPRPVWWWLHLLSYPAFLLSLVHGMLAGTDTQATASIWVYISTAGVVGALTFARLLGRGWTTAATEA